MGEKVSFVTLRAKNQLTLPAEASRAAHLCAGDPIEVRVVPEGILLLPKKIVDANQAWFWAPSWLEGEREASEDIARGRITHFESDEDFLNSLT
jgi:antitoxin PrlF